jgi:hypothetical protein
MKTGRENHLFLDGGADVTLDAATTRRDLDETFCLTQQWFYKEVK